MNKKILSIGIILLFIGMTITSSTGTIIVKDETQPELSGIWHTDEMMIKSGGKWSWLWHTMDRDTRFMVANMISNTWNCK